MVLIIYLFIYKTRFLFIIQKLAKFSSNIGKGSFEGLIHLLRYIRDNKNLGLRYYAKIEYTPIYDLLIQASINSENQLTVLSDSV